MYAYGTLKPVEVILRRWEGKKREYLRGSTKPGYTVCIYGKTTMKPPVKLICTN
jgi:hypothetical protein